MKTRLSAGNKAAIEFKDVSVRRGEKLILKDLTFNVPEGAFLGIIGPNGGGKTTLLKAILGLVRLEKGEIRIFGLPPDKIKTKGEVVGYVPQQKEHVKNFPASVFEVVQMGRYGRIGLFRRPTAADGERVRKSLAFVGMEELAGVPIDELSGGQQQRVFIARALAAEPRILLLDEPTTGVDAKTRSQFYNLLMELHSQLSLTIIMVSHDIAVVFNYCDIFGCLNQTMEVHNEFDEDLLRREIAQKYGEDSAIFIHHH